MLTTMSFFHPWLKFSTRKVLTMGVNPNP
jgi:hypothetical protein